MGSKLNLLLPANLFGLRAPASILDQSLAVVRHTTLGAPGSDIELDPGIYAARAVLPDGRAFEAAFEIPKTAGVTDVTLNAASPADRSGQPVPTSAEARSEPWFESVIVRERGPVQFDLTPPQADYWAKAGVDNDSQAFRYAADPVSRVSLVTLDASGEISAECAAPVEVFDFLHVDRKELSRFARIEQDGAPDLYIAAPTSAVEGFEIYPSLQMPFGFEIKLEDEHADLLLRYLTRGRLEQLTWLVTDAWETELRSGDRYAKPVAAAVGAYVILLVGAPKTGEAGHPHPDDCIDRWTNILFQSAPWLVDGLCLRAEALARQGDHFHALDLLLDLRSRGLPMFSGGLRFALDRLTSYRTAARVGKLDPAYVVMIDAVLDTLFRTAAGVDFDRPILTFRPSLAQAAKRRDDYEASSNLRQN